uniref:Uncharacterized protein n=1 Tax=Acrobeloides nanus TaxID=290746 RepID=A0A914CHZ9_9BILA
MVYVIILEIVMGLAFIGTILLVIGCFISYCLEERRRNKNKNSIDNIRPMHLMESAKLYPIIKTPEKNPLLPSQNNQEIDGWQYQNASAPTLSRVNTQKEQAKPQITQNVDKDTQTEQCYIGPVNAKTANGAQKVAYPELDPLHATLDDYLDEKSSMNESFSDEHI